ncbi:MAG: hypothetical protein JO316_21690 [Abitibacteriaceae bacterium]|nr:hypothetical protein [Abditibacteriaceae bacterium]MBV9867977.1 hypothetical protein [Abditibacteriaceae bacterium]
MKFILCVSLWIRNDDITAFESVERQAAQLMAKYGGRIERAIRVTSEPDDFDAPFEVHIVSFPDQNRFDLYRQDPKTQDFSRERDKVIAKTTVIQGYDIDLG